MKAGFQKISLKKKKKFIFYLILVKINTYKLKDFHNFTEYNLYLKKNKNEIFIFKYIKYKNLGHFPLKNEKFSIFLLKKIIVCNKISFLIIEHVELNQKLHEFNLINL